MARVGFFQSQHVLPIIGAGAYTGHENKLCTAMEGIEQGSQASTTCFRDQLTDHFRLVYAVFKSTTRAVALLQIRAPIIEGREEQFAAELLQWAGEAGFARVVLLAGSQPLGTIATHR